MVANGWQLFYCKVFKAALDELEAVVTQFAANDPEGYKSHPKTKLLASIYRAVTQLVPANPEGPEFRLGKTLGPGYTNWRRVRKEMPDRYRLFFRFASNPMKAIVYVWQEGRFATKARCARPNRRPTSMRLSSGCSRVAWCRPASTTCWPAAQWLRADKGRP